MEGKRIRYITRIFTIDRINQSISNTVWDNDNFEEFLKMEEKHYGTKLISKEKEVSIIIEYTNIIWNYKIYFGSYKKRFKPLIKDDERWQFIEKYLEEDLKMMGLDSLKAEVLNCLINNKYFIYNEKQMVQFKRYCV